MLNTTSTAANVTASAFVEPFDSSGVAVIATLLITFMISGFILNSLTIVVILKSNILRTDKFMMMILSLCCSDITSSLISWIWLYRRTWGFSEFSPVPPIFCKIFFGADLMTSFSTSLHVLVFTCMRYVAIRHPHKFKLLTRKIVKILIASFWLLGLIVGFIPNFLWTSARTRDRNKPTKDAKWPACTITLETLDTFRIYTIATYIPLFIVPVVLVVIMSAVITWTVHTRSFASQFKVNDKRKRRDRQAIIQLVLIAFLFVLGYTPFSAYMLWTQTGQRPHTPYYARLDYWFGASVYISLRFSETMNPIFYNLGSPKMRSQTCKLLSKLLCFEIKAAPQVTSSSNGQSRTENVRTLNS